MNAVIEKDQTVGQRNLYFPSFDTYDVPFRKLQNDMINRCQAGRAFHDRNQLIPRYDAHVGLVQHRAHFPL